MQKNDITPIIAETATIGNEALKRIKRGSYVGKIISVFNNSLLILEGDNKPISVVGKELPSGPINIKLNNSFCYFKEIADFTVGDSILRKQSYLVYFREDCTFKIDLTNAKVWKPNEVLEINNMQEISESLAFIKEILMGHESECSEEIGCKTFPDLTEYIQGLSDLLKKSIIQKNLPRILVHCKNLVGLGFGLTPCGDDFLAGLMAGMNITAKVMKRNVEYVEYVNKQILRSARGKTNILSEDLLYHASKGLVCEHHNNLITEILSGRKRKAAKYLKKILSIGVSSGKYFVKGAVCGIELAQKMS